MAINGNSKAVVGADEEEVPPGPRGLTILPWHPAWHPCSSLWQLSGQAGQCLLSTKRPFPADNVHALFQVPELLQENSLLLKSSWPQQHRDNTRSAQWPQREEEEGSDSQAG